MQRPALTVDIERGTVRFPAAVVARYFPTIEAVVMLIDGARLRILPVLHAANGGCLLKHRNAAGDRVAAAFDVFAANGLAEFQASALPALWSSEESALIVDLPII